MAIDLSEHRLVNNYGEGAYLEQMQLLLPRGTIWEFLIGSGLLATVIFQDIVDSEFQIQDIIPAGGDGIQDVSLGNLGQTVASTLWGRLLSCFAVELSRLHSYAVELLNQRLPGLSTEGGLLTDWEKALGLPDDCALATDYDTLEKRQELVHVKRYGDYLPVTNAYLIAEATRRGFIVTIEELSGDETSAIMGDFTMGDSVMGDGIEYGVLKVTYTNLGSGDLEKLQCWFNANRNAHTVFIWEEA